MAMTETRARKGPTTAPRAGREPRTRIVAPALRLPGRDEPNGAPRPGTHAALCAGFARVLASAFTLLLPLAATAAADSDRPGSRHCSQTANLMLQSCDNEVADDHFKARAICTNLDDEEREECFDEAQEARVEGLADCRAQRTARRNLCALVGEDRYDPDFDPELFEDDFTDPGITNPYQPLTIGNEAEYEGDGETIVIEVKGETKLIDGVTCIVVTDQVFVEGELVEDTDDWFAQAKDGDVWYCGEEAKDYETFEGDEPMLPELVSIDGSFKAGRDGDKPGVLIRAMPTVGEVYRQEFSLGNAEDVAQVLSSSYGYGADPDLDQHVPAALAQLLCANDCVVTREFSPLSPNANERKFYAPGIGLFLEVNMNSGDTVQLVDCNYDDRCEDLPEK
jgi:hypothetical protein